MSSQSMVHSELHKSFPLHVLLNFLLQGEYFLFLYEIRPEYFVPERRAYSISPVGVDVVMSHVVVLHFFPKPGFKIDMVDGVMREVVKQITDDKAREKSRQIGRWKQSVKQRIK